MNDCTPYEWQLAAYAAGELSEPDLGALESHLACCVPCQDELAREIELRTLLAGLPPVSCPERVTAAVHASVARAENKTPAGPARAWPAGLTLIAATLLAILLVPTLWQGPNDTGPGELPVAVDTARFTTAEIKQARREVIATLVLAANILDRNRDKTVVDVFGARLPRAISESLRPHAIDAQKSTRNPNPAHTGGNG